MADENNVDELDESGNPIVFFDVALGGESLGRIKMELFADVTPRTAENFRQFCTGESKDPITGKPQGYKDTKFHRVIKGFMLQGGDFVKADGTGSATIYQTKYFKDENFDLKHDRPGRLSMANFGTADTNGCQFFITVQADPRFDYKHVVFGQVIEGMDIVHMINNTKTNSSEKPLLDVVITQCGEM